MAKEHVHGVFQSIAGQYDAANDRISLGMHRKWKADLAQMAAAVSEASFPGMVLDVCCGTGDIAESIASAHPEIFVTGLDFSSEMLAAWGISALICLTNCSAKSASVKSTI